MVRFTAIQTDGFKSNNLPSTKIAFWTNKKTPSSAASLVIQSIFSFTSLLRQVQDARFGYCPSLFPSSLRKATRLLCGQSWQAEEQHRSPPTRALPPDPCKGQAQWFFPSGQYRQCIPILHQNHLVSIKYLTIRYNNVFISSS